MSNDGKMDQAKGNLKQAGGDLTGGIQSANGTLGPFIDVDASIDRVRDRPDMHGHTRQYDFLSIVLRDVLRPGRAERAQICPREIQQQASALRSATGLDLAGDSDIQPARAIPAGKGIVQRPLVQRLLAADPRRQIP